MSSSQLIDSRTSFGFEFGLVEELGGEESQEGYLEN